MKFDIDKLVGKNVSIIINGGTTIIGKLDQLKFDNIQEAKSYIILTDIKNQQEQGIFTIENNRHIPIPYFKVFESRIAIDHISAISIVE